MTKTMQLVLAMAMVVAPMVRAQQAEVQPAVADSGDATQATYVAQAIGIAFKDDLFAGRRSSPREPRTSRRSISIPRRWAWFGATTPAAWRTG